MSWITDQMQSEDRAASSSSNTNWIVDEMRNEDQAAHAQAALAVGMASSDNADEAARNAAMAKRFNTTPDVVSAYPKEFRDRVALEMAKENLANAPKLTNYINNTPGGAQMVHPDVPHLANLEQAAQSDWTDTLKQTALAIPQGLGLTMNRAATSLSELIGLPMRGVDSLAGTNSYGWWRAHTIDPLLRDRQYLEPDQNAPFLPKAAHAAASTLETLALAGLTGGSGEAGQVAQSTTNTVDAIGAQLLHGLRGMLAPAAIDAIDTGREVYDRTGDKVAALKAASAQFTSSEMMGVVPMSAPGGLIQRTVTGLGVGTVMGELSRQYMNANMPEDMQTPWNSDEAIISGLTGGIFGAFGPHALHPYITDQVRQTYRDAARMESIERDAQQLNTMGQLAQAVKLRETNPEEFKRAAQLLTEDGRLEDIYIDGKVFAQALDKAGVTMEELEQKTPEVADQLREALQLGTGDVKISTADYLANIAGSKIDQDVLQNFKAQPDGATLKEAQEFWQGHNEKMQEASDRVIKSLKQGEEFNKSAAELSKTIQTQLDATGRYTPPQSKTNAAITTAILSKQAAREGISPMEAWKKYGQVIGTRAGGGFEQTIEHTPEFKEWSRNAPIVDSEQAKTHDFKTGEKVVVQAYHGSAVGGLEKADRRNTFFTTGKDVANSYAENAPAEDHPNLSEARVNQEMYVRALNPLVVDAQGGMWHSLEFKGKTYSTNDLVREAQKLGHDAIIVKDVYDDIADDLLEPSTVIITLGKEGQFKSVFNKTPTNGPDILNQSATLRSGEETLADYGLDPNGKYTVRQVAEALEARQHEKYGSIARNDRSPEAADKIANWMAEEVKFEMQHPRKSGVGWYSTKFQRALDQFGEIFPELKRGNKEGLTLPDGTKLNAKESRGILTALIAITSDGQSVVPNFRQAIELYSSFRDTGKFESERKHNRQASIDNNLGIVQGLFEKMGAKGMREYLMQEATVSDLRKIAKAEGVDFNTEYQAHIKLPLAAVVFGPKLGAFYANLMGSHGYLTMDRWWSRSFNRYRGTLIPEPTEAGLKRLKDLLGKPDLTDEQAIEETVPLRKSYEAKKFKNGTELEKAANTIWKAAYGELEDAPFNASDRTFMLDSVGKAQQLLAKEGRNISIADIQAILWYYEKRLYGELGARQSADVSYEEAAKRVSGEHAESSTNSAGGRPALGDREAAFQQDAAAVRGSADEGNPADEQFVANAGDRGGLGDSAGPSPLPGAPQVSGFHGPDPRLVRVAERYARDNGISLKRQAEYVQVDADRAARIAQAYADMAHAPQDPAVKEAYDNLIKQTTAQYHALEDAGYNFWFIDPKADPYKSPWDAMRDMRKNQSMGVFATADGFGSSEEFKPEENPLLADTGIKWHYGGPDGPLVPVLANDLFRAVHDAFGHGLEGAGFRAQGEENAWQAHSRLFTGSALGAITTETRGQNSWLNYGPHGETNRTAKVEDTVFADQKTGLMPEWTWKEGVAGDMPDTLGQEARGSYTPQDRLVSLFKGADLSTYLHETGHWALDIYGKIAASENAPPEVREDMDKVLKWFGVDSLEKWNAMSIDEQRPHHEQFARAFEQYLMEGKAPSQELQPFFARIREWMTQIYKSLSALNVPMTDEVRGVFDRMLASDDAITEAERARNLGLPKEKPAYISDADWAALKQDQSDMHGEAVDELSAQKVRNMKWGRGARARTLKDLQKQSAEARREVRIDARRDILGQPIYQAWQFLTGKIPDEDKISAPKKYKTSRVNVEQDTLLEAVAKLGGITRESAHEHLGVHKDDYNHSVGVFGSPPFRKDGGKHADYMAQLLKELGYLKSDEHGSYDIKELEDKVHDSLSGIDHYSMFYDHNREEPVAGAEHSRNPLSAGRLDEASLRAAGLDEASIEKLKARKMVAKHGIDADLVAEIFGLDGGRKMAMDLAAMEPPGDAIEGLTDRYMMERHDDLASPEGMQAAADRILANEMHGKFAATVLKTLAKAQVSAGAIFRGAEEAARAAIAAKRVGDLNPRQYLSAETKANKEMLKLAPKDTQGAVAAQRASLLANRMTKAAYDAQDDVREALKYAKSFDKRAKRLKLDPEERDLIDSLLERFDFRQVPPEGPTKKQIQLQRWVDAQKASGYTPIENPDMLDESVRMHYKDMTVGQLRGLMDTVKAIEKIARARKTVTIEGKRMELDEAVAPIIEKMQERGEKFSDEELVNRPRAGVDPMWRVALDRVSSWLRGVGSELKRPDYKGNAWDLHEILGPAQRAIIEPLFGASYRFGDYMDEINTKKREGVAKYGLDADWQKSLNTVIENHNLADNSLEVPAKRRLTRGDMIGIALHVGNESNFDKLTQGMRWGPEEVWKFLDENMTEKDWNAAKLLGELAGSHWDEMAAMNRRLGNDTPDKIEPRPFMTKFGEMPGWYAPVDYDPIRSKLAKRKADERAVNPAEGLFSRDYYRADTTTNGSLNARASGYYDFLDLNWTPLERRITDTMRDLAYREALIDVHKLYSHNEFRRQFMRTFGREEYEHIGDWLGRLVNSNVQDQNQSRWVAISAGLRRAMVANGVAFRMSTVVKHGGSAAFKSLGYMVGGEKYYVARQAAMTYNYKNEVAEALAKFPEIRQRLRQQDRDFGQAVMSIANPESLHGKAERFGHAFVANADFFTAVATANAAYDMAVTEGVPKRLGGTGKPMSEADAIKFASKVVREAHGSTNEASMSLLMTEQSEWMKNLTMLHGFMNNSYGQMTDAADKALHSSFGKPELLARVMAAQIVPALLIGAVVGHKKDDQSYLSWALENIGGEFAGMLPMVREAYQDVIEGRTDAGIPPWLKALTEIHQVVKDVEKEHAGETPKHPIKDVGNAAGLLLPGLGQGGATAQFLHDEIRGEQHAQTVSEWIHGLMTGQSKTK